MQCNNYRITERPQISFLIRKKTGGLGRFWRGVAQSFLCELVSDFPVCVRVIYPLSSVISRLVSAIDRAGASSSLCSRRISLSLSLSLTDKDQWPRLRFSHPPAAGLHPQNTNTTKLMRPKNKDQDQRPELGIKDQPQPQSMNKTTTKLMAPGIGTKDQD